MIRAAYGGSNGLVILGDSAKAVKKSLRIRRPAAVISFGKRWKDPVVGNDAGVARGRLAFTVKYPP